MHIILGVDPGYSEKSPGALVALADGVPFYIRDNTQWANQHEPYAALRYMLRSLPKPDLIVVEKQHARATRDKHGKVVQGIASTWNYAEHYGILLGCLATYDTPIVRVDPGVWKANLHLDRDKEKSLELARKLFPNHTEVFTLKKHHGRAEAALLAKYGERFDITPKKRRVL